MKTYYLKLIDIISYRLFSKLFLCQISRVCGVMILFLFSSSIGLKASSYATNQNPLIDSYIHSGNYALFQYLNVSNSDLFAIDLQLTNSSTDLANMECTFEGNFETGTGTFSGSVPVYWWAPRETPSYYTQDAHTGSQSALLKGPNNKTASDYLEYSVTGFTGPALLIKEDCPVSFSFWVKNLTELSGSIEFYINGTLIPLPPAINPAISFIDGWTQVTTTLNTHPDIYSFGFSHSTVFASDEQVPFLIDDVCVISECIAEEECCVDEEKFNNLVNLGMEVTVNGCEVTVAIPQFDSCYYTSYDGPSSWGDGTILLPATASLPNGPWTHTYNNPGTYLICINVFEMNSQGEACWNAQICEEVTVECPKSCPPLECEQLSIRLESEEIGNGECCYNGTIINDWCDSEISCISIKVDSAIISQMTIDTNWVFYSVNPNEILVCYKNGPIPFGAHDVFKACISTSVAALAEVCWLREGIEGFIPVCCEEFEILCSGPEGCLTVLEDSINCETNEYCFKLQNVSNPGFIVNEIHINPVTPSGAINPVIINTNLAPGNSAWYCVTYDGTLNPGDSVCFQLSGHNYDENPKKCCQDAIENCFIIPECELCEPIDCELLDIEITPTEIGEGLCCYEATITNNWCDEDISCLRIKVDSAVISQMVLDPNWAFFSFNHDEVIICYQNGPIPKGTHQVFTACISNSINTVAEVCWLQQDNEEFIPVCCEKFEILCEGPEGCLTVLEDSINCKTNEYCFKVENVSNPGFTIKEIVINPVTPSGAINPVIINTNLAPGSSAWYCVTYDGALNPGDSVCYELTGHNYDKGSTCCQDAIEHCFIIPECKNCEPIDCELLEIEITPTEIGEGLCCYEATITNNWCDEDIRCLRIKVDSAVISQMVLDPNWGFFSFNHDEIIICYQNGPIPIGTHNVFRACISNSINTVAEVCWLQEENEEFFPICCEEFEILCEGPEGCLTVLEDSLNCETNDYCFKVQNVSNPGFTINQIVINPITPAGALSPVIINTNLAPGSSEWFCVKFDGTLNPGDSICYELTGHNYDGEPTCCQDAIENCFIVPECECEPADCNNLSTQFLTDTVFEGICCYYAEATNNDCKDRYKGIKICTNDATNLSYVQANSGWYISQLSSTCAELRIIGNGYIPVGTVFPFTFCPDTLINSASFTTSWIEQSGSDTTYTCETEHELQCDGPPDPAACLEVLKDSIDCKNDKYCFLVKNVSNPAFDFGSLVIRNISPSGSITTQIISLQPKLAFGDSIWVCVDYAAQPQTNICFEINASSEDLNVENYAITCCTQTVKLCFTIPECGKDDPKDCCSDSLDFQFLINQGYVMTIDSGRVTISLPQFDSCHYLNSAEPDWGDGTPYDQSQTVNLGSNPIWMHRYTNGGMFNICLEVVEYDSNGEICNQGPICKMLFIDKSSQSSDPFACDPNEVFVPNGITPNGDGMNDVLKIISPHDCQSVDIKVYNRWGQLVFEDYDYQNDWAGLSLENKQLPDATYYLMVDFNGINNTEIKHSRYTTFLDIRTK